MSRDWRPNELFEVNRFNKEKEGRDFRDMRITIRYNGKEFPRFSEEQYAFMKNYPELWLLCPELLCHCREKMTDEKVRDRVLSRIESEVAKAEEGDATDETVKKWFDGELEPGYYMDENTEAFGNYLWECYEAEKCK